MGKAIGKRIGESEAPQIEALEDLPGVQVYEALDYCRRSNVDNDE